MDDLQNEAAKNPRFSRLSLAVRRFHFASLFAQYLINRATARFLTRGEKQVNVTRRKID